MDIQRPYLLFLGAAPDHLAIKTAAGILDWRRDWCVGQLRLPGCVPTLDLPELDLEAAKAQGARTLVIGVVNPGGTFPDTWTDTILEAIALGFDVASGLHTRLTSFPAIAEAAARHGRKLHDVRHSAERFPTGSGRKRTGMRILTVGTDCAIGKKYTALVLERDMQAHGLKATFRATGQTGVLIAGRGVAIDAVVADFISGAAEWLSPDNEPDHWDVVEGQGSLFHPSFAGVTLGLLHGSQPDAFVVCHEPTRRTMRNVATPIARIEDVIEETVRLGRLTNPAIACVGLAVNTSEMPEADVDAYLGELRQRYDLPAVDPIRHGTAPIVERLKAQFPV